MSDARCNQEDTVPLDVVRRIDEVACAFERDWAEGRQPQIEDFLPRIAEAERLRLL